MVISDDDDYEHVDEGGNKKFDQSINRCFCHAYMHIYVLVSAMLN